MAYTNVQRVDRIYQHLWSGDEAVDPYPQAQGLEATDAFVARHPQYWPLDSEGEPIYLDPGDFLTVPEGMTNNHKAMVVIRAMRNYARAVRHGWRIDVAEADAREQEQDEIGTEPEPPPVEEGS